MREILFRGQIRKKGEKVKMSGEPVDGRWIYGGVFAPTTDGAFAVMYGVKGTNGEAGIQDSDLEKFPVYRDTIGQFTGHFDKNQKRIFEGDIVKLQGGGGLLCFNSRDYVGVVKHSQNGGIRATIFQFYIQAFNDPYNEADFNPDTMEVIGNIYDNPELIEKGGEQTNV